MILLYFFINIFVTLHAECHFVTQLCVINSAELFVPCVVVRMITLRLHLIIMPTGHDHIILPCTVDDTLVLTFRRPIFPVV
jgi:hypothetical protein